MTCTRVRLLAVPLVAGRGVLKGEGLPVKLRRRMMLATGTALDPWQIMTPLGASDMGELVDLSAFARDIQFDRPPVRGGDQNRALGG